MWWKLTGRPGFRQSPQTEYRNCIRYLRIVETLVTGRSAYSRQPHRHRKLMNQFSVHWKNIIVFVNDRRTIFGEETARARDTDSYTAGRRVRRTVNSIARPAAWCEPENSILVRFSGSPTRVGPPGTALPTWSSHHPTPTPTAARRGLVLSATVPRATLTTLPR